MENEKIAALVLALMVALPLGLWLGYLYYDDISDNLNENTPEDTSDVVEVGDCVDVHYILRYASNDTFIQASYEDMLNRSGGTPLKVFVSLNQSHMPPEKYAANYSSQMIKGFIEGLIGLEKGKTANFTVKPRNGYGVWNVSLADTNGLNPFSLEMVMEQVSNTSKNFFTNYGINTSVNTTFDYGYYSLQIRNVLNATIIDNSSENIEFRINAVDNTDFFNSFYNCNSTIFVYNDTHFTIRNYLEVNDTFSQSYYGMPFHFKVMDIDGVTATLAMNTKAPKIGLIGKTLSYEVEIVDIIKTSED